MWGNVGRVMAGFSGYSGSLQQYTDSHDITEILLKVALNTITINKTMVSSAFIHVNVS
jgi:hypothetical protein